MAKAARTFRRRAACALAAMALAAPAPCRAADPGALGDAYIVLLHDSIPAGDIARTAAQLIARHGGTLDHVYRDGLKGFAARLAPISATGMRHDARVAGLEPLAAAPAPASSGLAAESADDAPVSAAAVTTPTVTERLPFAPGGHPKFRRVLTPAADRYVVVLAASVAAEDAERAADRLMRTYGGRRDLLKVDAFGAEMSEDAAKQLSRDVSVAYVEEESTLSPADAASLRAAPPRRLPGQGLRRVAQPMRDRYRFALRPNVPDEQLASTIDELLRAYEGRRQKGPAEGSRVVVVEMSEPSALALSDDFRVEYVEEQAVPARAGTR